MKLPFLTILFAIVVSAGYSQTHVVHGRLTAFNQFPVANMEVSSKKAKSVVKTDSLGQFSIECNKKDLIRIQSKVFQSYSTRVTLDTDSLQINLVFINSRSNREVATGFGYMSEEDLAFSTSNLEHQNNDFCNYSSVYDLLAGRFPGVNVNGGGIYIRGSEERALTVVDGIISGGIGWIVPCDIKSINIIKDGMSAMYGSRGGNGVVVIETLRGSPE